MKLIYTVVVLTTILALASATADDPPSPCCNECTNGQIKTFSIIARNHLCGESCIDPNDFWKFKIFEPKLEKADDPAGHPCADAGYVHYNETEVHGFKPILTVKLDMYDDLHPANYTPGSDDPVPVTPVPSPSGGKQTWLDRYAALNDAVLKRVKDLVDRIEGKTEAEIARAVMEDMLEMKVSQIRQRYADLAEKPTLGKDGHGQWVNRDDGLLGKDGHGQFHGDDGLLGKDGHGQFHGDDGLLGKDGHGQYHGNDRPRFGRDGHGQWHHPHHGSDVDGLLGKDGHGVWHGYPKGGN